jgi:hypothetical protein
VGWRARLRLEIAWHTELFLLCGISRSTPREVVSSTPRDEGLITKKHTESVTTILLNR